MKALTFIEFTEQAIAHDRNIPYDKVNEVFADKVCRAYGLYEREFEAWMIPNLFEGWGEERWVGGGLLYQVDRKYRVHDSAIFYLRYEVMNTRNTLWMEKFKVLKPNTINEFVSDCKRAGMELKWSEEIIKEYFE